MRSRLLAIVGLCLVNLTGCGSTIVTRLHSRDVLHFFPARQSARQAWRIEKRSGIAPPRARSLQEAAHALARWANGDPERLTLAAEAVLDMRPRGSERIQNFALAALQLADRSLHASGVPASRWLETAATRKTIAVYNASLDRFVSLKCGRACPWRFGSKLLDSLRANYCFNKIFRPFALPGRVLR